MFCPSGKNKTILFDVHLIGDVFLSM
jgi:hypothetical protein